MSAFFISAIDTGVGKSVAAGLLASYLRGVGKRVVTFKPAQTGCEGIAEDILLHRKLAGQEIMSDDLDGTTCPYVFPVPASPHLAAELAGREIDVQRLDESLKKLDDNFDFVLTEGAGGLMVPLTRDLLFIDWAVGHNMPLILVTSSRLGSINHTSLSLEAARSRGMRIAGIIYNLHPAGEPHIAVDSLKVISAMNPGVPIVEMPELKDGEPPEIDFGVFFGDKL